MASEADVAQESVVLASLDSRHAAEHMLASLGRDFRKKARKGHVAAFVVSGNTDGSLKLTQSRVLEASGFAATIIRVSLSWTVGFLGTLSTLRGAKGVGHAAHVRAAHVESDECAAHAILAEAGPDAAVALVCCDDADTRHAVAARAADRASHSWDGSRTEFLAALDPGSKHDWVRIALDEPSATRQPPLLRLHRAQAAWRLDGWLLPPWLTGVGDATHVDHRSAAGQLESAAVAIPGEYLVAQLPPPGTGAVALDVQLGQGPPHAYAVAPRTPGDTGETFTSPTPRIPLYD